MHKYMYTLGCRYGKPGCDDVPVHVQLVFCLSELYVTLFYALW